MNNDLSRALVRKYLPGDREAVRKTCYDTGLMGDPIDPYFGCMELFADYWMNYYTDYEPESAFVAELDGKVIGYLVGCKDTSIQMKIHGNEILPEIRRRLLTLDYKIDRRFFRFLHRYLRSMWRGEFRGKPLEEPIDGFPAHLHMNLSKGYRSGGIGSKLLSAYLDYLRSGGVRGMHLGTTSANKLAVPFYGKWGFRLVSRGPLTMYDGIVPEDPKDPGNPKNIEKLFFTREIT